MASKKEHKRKQKNRTPRRGDENNAFFLPGAEINSLDLLSTVYSVPKATEGRAADPEPDNDAADEQARRDAEEAELKRREDESRRQAEEEDRRLREAEAAAQARAEEEARRQAEAAAAEQAHREAEEAEQKRREDEARRAAEEEDRRLREAEAAAQARAEEEARRQAEAAAAEQARREAEEAELKRREEEARRQAEEENRRLREAEAAAQARAEEETRRQAEAAAAEQARREAEEAELKRREDEARRLAEEEERRLREAEAAAQARAEEEARRAAEEAERRRRDAEAAEKARLEAEAAEKARAEAEAAERKRREDEAAAIARQAEAARQKAEAEEQLRREREAAARRAAEEAEAAERRRQEALAAERAKRLEEEAERARRMTAQVEEARARSAAPVPAAPAEGDLARQEALAAERARQLAAETAPPAAGVSERLHRAAATRHDPVPAAPVLEVDNPYWQKPPEIFDVLSGAPHGAETPDYVAAAGGDATLPVTMTPERGEEQRLFAPPGFRSDDPSEGESSRASYAVPLEKRMYIVMVTPEVAPAAKVGGLGDVILGLGRELMRRGHGVEVICPMYSSMRYDLIEDLHEEYSELWCPHYNEWRPEKVFQGRVGGDLQVNFITGGTYTERPSIYGFDDDLQRFTYFSRAALEFMYKTNRRPDIIHCHDWATGLVPPILWDIYQKLGWDNSRVVYTIHNNECQGLCGFGDKLLSLVGLDIRDYMRPDRMQDDTHKNCINMMKAGIVYSNFVTTVSPTYAGELKSAAGGRGLQTTIAKNSAKVGGVLNGIDYETWNPATDVKLASRYSAGDDFFAKYENKKALREWLGLWDAWKPIIAVVTRLTHQKGLDLIKHAIYSAQPLQAQFVLLGSAPDPKVNNDFLRLQHELRDNHDINLYIGYHEDLSHVIYAGSDMFLVPSLYEPCGLTQMISLRYGTVPIVRETGGLMDTVFDLDNSGLGLNEANGFTFRDTTPLSLDYGLERAVRLWYDNPDAFNRLARNGMRYDYSWRHPAEHYENIYNYIKA